MPSPFPQCHLSVLPPQQSSPKLAASHRRVPAVPVLYQLAAKSPPVACPARRRIFFRRHRSEKKIFGQGCYAATPKSQFSPTNQAQNTVSWLLQGCYRVATFRAKVATRLLQGCYTVATLLPPLKPPSNKKPGRSPPPGNASVNHTHPAKTTCQVCLSRQPFFAFSASFASASPPGVPGVAFSLSLPTADCRLPPADCRLPPAH